MTSELDELNNWRLAPERLRYWASTEPDRPFFRCDNDWYTFGGVERETDAIAAGFVELGVQPGDRVAILLPNSDDYILAMLALAKLGAIQVPLNVYLRGAFLRHQLADSGAKALLTDAAGVRAAHDLRGTLPDLATVLLSGSPPEGIDAATVVPFRTLRDSGLPFTPPVIDPHNTLAVMYTSGTTGPSKGCILSHGFYMFLPRAWFANDWYRTTDRLLTAVPLFHISGQGMTLMSALLGGMPVTVLPVFSASTFIDSCREAGATTAFGVGPMGMAILATPQRETDRDHDLRTTIFPPMTPSARDKFFERFEVPVVSDAYGQTECNPIAQSPLALQSSVPGSLGKPVPWHDVQLLDDNNLPVPQGTVGEIAVRPKEPMVMYDGYWNNPEATVNASRDLWHHTGDYAFMNDEGYLIFVDRKKDAMRRRGENVSSVELETAIVAHPKIAAVATHAVPSPLGEDDIKACIVLTPGSEFTPEELHSWLADQLPYFAIPRYVEFLDSLPTNALGRVLKYKLRESPNEYAWDFEALELTVAKTARR